MLKIIAERLRMVLARLWATPAGSQVAVTIATQFGGPLEPPAGLRESRDLAHAHPILRERCEALRSDYEAQTGRQLFYTCVYRSEIVQAELYQVGRRGIAGEAILTNCDGVTNKSFHNCYLARAVDVAIDTDPGPGKVVTWDAAAFAPIGPLAAKHGLVWGGNWTRFKDLPHLELPRNEGWA